MLKQILIALTCCSTIMALERTPRVQPYNPIIAVRDRYPQAEVTESTSLLLLDNTSDINLLPRQRIKNIANAISWHEVDLVKNLLAQEFSWVSDLYQEIGSQNQWETLPASQEAKRRLLFAQTLFSHIDKAIDEEVTFQQKKKRVCRIIGAPILPVKEEGYLRYGSKKKNWAPLFCNGTIAVIITILVPLLGLGNAPWKIDLNEPIYVSCLDNFVKSPGPWPDSASVEFLSNCTSNSMTAGLPCGYVNSSDPQSQITMEQCCQNLIINICKNHYKYYNEHIYPEQKAQAWLPTQIIIPLLGGCEVAFLTGTLLYYRAKRNLRAMNAISGVVAEKKREFLGLDGALKAGEAPIT